MPMSLLKSAETNSLSWPEHTSSSDGNHGQIHSNRISLVQLDHKSVADVPRL